MSGEGKVCAHPPRAQDSARQEGCLEINTGNHSYVLPLGVQEKQLLYYQTIK